MNSLVGQRQRIVITRALILNLNLLFVMNPYQHWTCSIQAQVLNLLNDLKKELGFYQHFHFS